VTSVLALRALGLGDALTGIPALRGLRRLFPEHQLLLATSAPIGGWLEALAIVDGVVVADGLTGLPRVGPAVAVDLHGRGPESHRLLLEQAPGRMIAFDCPAAGYRSTTKWRADEHEVHRWCRLISAAGGACSPADLHLTVGGTGPPTAPGLGSARSGVILHPGAASGARRWPPERWVQVAQELIADGHDVVVTGTEAELCAQVSGGSGAKNLSGDLSLSELTDLVGSTRLVLSGDTGVAHLATATATPSVTLFGPVSPALWGPAIDPQLHTVLYHGSAPGDPHGADPDPALLRISVPEVLRAARAQLAGTRPPSP
jgi:ADP-heptose:LPS heptosyltransferase